MSGSEGAHATSAAIEFAETGGALTPSPEGTLAWYPRRAVLDGSLPDLMDDLHRLLPRVLAAAEPIYS